MIHLFWGGEYEEVYVRAVYEVPDEVEVTLTAFLQSLGHRPYPSWDKRHNVLAYAEDVSLWNEEKEQVLKLHKISPVKTDEIKEAHRKWIESLPGVTSLPFEDLE